MDDLRQRAQARRHREATPERDALVHDQRQRAQLSQETQEATPERDARLDGQRRRTQARRHREATILRDERLDAQRRRIEARRCGETTSVRERYARKIVSNIMHEEKLIIKLHCLASLLSIKR